MAAILVVDDDFGIREHLIAYLGDLGHEVEPAPDALTGLALLDRRAFDVVLSDVRMAGMDGFAMLRELRRRYPATGVVLMTAYASVAEAVEASRGGAYDYLVKPFSLDQLGQLLGRVLEVQTTGRQNGTISPVDSLEDVERVHVQRVLTESPTLQEAALRLGINPTTLWRKRKRWHLE